MSVTPGPVLARDAAVCLSEHSKRRRIPPVNEVYAQADFLRMTVGASSTATWVKWCQLLRVDPASVKHERGTLTARGQWAGVHVMLTVVGCDEWWVKP